MSPLSAAAPDREAASNGHGPDAEREGLLADTAPPVPQSLEKAELSSAFVSDLLLKVLYVQGARTGDRLAEFVHLPFPLLDDELLTLQQRRLVEVRGTQGHGRRGYTFDLSGEGRNRAREIMATRAYVGPAPVSLDQYWRSIAAQRMSEERVDPERVRGAFRHLVFEDGFLHTLGPAINSGRSLFLYGEAGNGKTSIAEGIADLLGDAIYVPYAVEVEGQIIGIYDPVAHQELPVKESAEGPAYLRAGPHHDPRFLRIRRPAVIVGGELTLDELELQWDEQTGAFRAPPQVRANGGVFIIDDFGRQRVRPRDLLNRWMVPLDRRTDYLSLPMGHKVPFPFECLLIFATNLNPAELVEEAFLRRIQYKLHVRSPTRAEYAEILRRRCESKGLRYTDEVTDFVYRTVYERGVAPRACHPRDIVTYIEDQARYLGVEPCLSEEMLERACRSCFLDVSPGGGEGAEES